MADPTESKSPLSYIIAKWAGRLSQLEMLTHAHERRITE
jgi:hypothetical protein